MKVPVIAFLFIIFVSALPARAQDKVPPERPYITYVTVDTSNNNTHIYWTKSPSTDVEKYYIYYEIKTINGYEGVKLDSVPADVSEYTHVNSGADKKSILYSVTAVDSSYNESIRKPGLHSTVFTSLKYDSCQDRMTVTWNKYQGWDDNVSGYRILRSIDNAPFTILTGVNPGDSTYIDNEIAENTSYRYLIEAVKNDGLESMSNIATKYTYMPPVPGNLAIDFATVASENSVEVSFSFVPNGEITDFTLLRSSNPVSDFQPVNDVYNLTTSSYLFSDDFITSTRYYYYRVGALNSCGEVIGTSNLAVNILLTGDTLGTSARLSWNPYEEWSSGVQEYRVYRKETDGSFTMLGTVPAGTTFYIDHLNGAINQHLSGELTYYVEAVSGSGGITSVSNQFKIRVSTTIIDIANAFTPNADGRNDSFIPVFDFRPSEFLMVIYNRTGTPIYSTEDPEKGWDGTVNGNNMAQEGVYVYHIQYKSYNGTRGEKTGHVTVFYP
jgi:gliding motility-associated-like protein